MSTKIYPINSLDYTQLQNEDALVTELHVKAVTISTNAATVTGTSGLDEVWGYAPLGLNDDGATTPTTQPFAGILTYTVATKAFSLALTCTTANGAYTGRILLFGKCKPKDV